MQPSLWERTIFDFRPFVLMLWSVINAFCYLLDIISTLKVLRNRCERVHGSIYTTLGLVGVHSCSWHVRPNIQSMQLELLGCMQTVWVLLDSQCAGGQVGVLVLQFSIQSEASFLSVVGQKWSESENFAESWTGSNDITEDRKISSWELFQRKPDINRDANLHYFSTLWTSHQC